MDFLRREWIKIKFCSSAHFERGQQFFGRLFRIRPADWKTLRKEAFEVLLISPLE